MSLNKRAVATLAVASALTTSIGLSSFIPLSRTWATEDDQANQQEDTISHINTDCQSAQENIDSIASIGYLTFTENCAANLTIPSGRTIILNTTSFGNNQPPILHHLADDGGDTVTVAQGATLYMLGSFANATANKSIINNMGNVVIAADSLEATNGAYIINNSGSLDISRGTFTNTAIQNTGTIRIAGGTYDKPDEIEPYVVAGTNLDKLTGVVTPFATFPSGDGNIPGMTGRLPVGYSFKIDIDYPDYADIAGFVIESQDESIVKVSGSNIEGWTIEVVGVGQANLFYGTHTLIGGAGTGSFIEGYEMSIEDVDGNDSLISNLLMKKLISKYSTEIRKALEAKERDDLKLTLGLSVSAIEDDINVEQTAEIAKVVGDDNVVGYYDITLHLDGDGEKLVDITDLGDTEDDVITVRVAIDPDSIEDVTEGHQRTYYVVRYHEGVASKIDAKLIDDELVFQSSKFSTYAVVYSDTKASTDQSDGEPEDGDSDQSNNDNEEDSAQKDPSEKDPSGSEPGDDPEDNSSDTESNPDIEDTPSTPDTGAISLVGDSNRVVLAGSCSVITVAVFILGVAIKKLLGNK